MAKTIITVRLSEELHKIVEQEAKKQKMTTAEYVRGAIGASLLFDGNTDFLKLAGKQLSKMLTEKIREVYKVEGAKISA